MLQKFTNILRNYFLCFGDCWDVETNYLRMLKKKIAFVTINMPNLIKIYFTYLNRWGYLSKFFCVWVFVYIEQFMCVRSYL